MSLLEIRFAEKAVIAASASNLSFDARTMSANKATADVEMSI
jgi:hypothetical protein